MLSACPLFDLEIASPRMAPRPGRLTRRLSWFGRGFRLQHTAVRDEHAGLGKLLQLRLAHAEFAEHLAVVLPWTSRRTDRRELIPGKMPGAPRQFVFAAA